MLYQAAADGDAQDWGLLAQSAAGERMLYQAAADGDVQAWALLAQSTAGERMLHQDADDGEGTQGTSTNDPQPGN